MIRTDAPLISLQSMTGFRTEKLKVSQRKEKVIQSFQSATVLPGDMPLKQPRG